MNDFKKDVLHRLIDLEMTRSQLAESLEISDSYLCDILNEARTSGTQKDRIIAFLEKKETEKHEQIDG